VVYKSALKSGPKNVPIDHVHAPRVRAARLLASILANLQRRFFAEHLPNYRIAKYAFPPLRETRSILLSDCQIFIRMSPKKIAKFFYFETYLQVVRIFLPVQSTFENISISHDNMLIFVQQKIMCCVRNLEIKKFQICKLKKSPMKSLLVSKKLPILLMRCNAVLL